MQPATEVARLVGAITEGAQWSVLAMRPLLLWIVILSPAVIAEVASDQAAINARPIERPWVTPRENIEGCLLELRTHLTS